MIWDETNILTTFQDSIATFQDSIATCILQTSISGSVTQSNFQAYSIRYSAMNSHTQADAKYKGYTRQQSDEHVYINKVV